MFGQVVHFVERQGLSDLYFLDEVPLTVAGTTVQAIPYSLEGEANVRDAASKCPSSVSPHAIRRGSITLSLNSELSDKVISDRANVSPQVIGQPYDRRTEREKIGERRDYLDYLQLNQIPLFFSRQEEVFIFKIAISKIRNSTLTWGRYLKWLSSLIESTNLIT